MKPKIGDMVQTNKGKGKVIDTDGIVAIIEHEDGLFTLLDVQSIKRVNNNVIPFRFEGNANG